MAKLISDTTLQAWADAIREKEGSTGSIKVSDMAQRILDLASGGGEFLGGAIETGTVTSPNETFTIPHNLGTLKGVILYWYYEWRDSYNLSIHIVDEICTTIEQRIGGSVGEVSTDDVIKANNTNSVTVWSYNYGSNVTYYYILLGA